MNYWWLLLPTGVAITGSCAPEVLIARAERGSGAAGSASGGSSSGGAATSGTGGGAVSGTANGDGGVGANGDGGANDGGIAGSGPTDPPSLLLADSVADFALVQGQRGWYYGFDTGTLDDFTLLPRTAAMITAFVPVSGDMWECWTTAAEHWTQIFQLGAHPNGTDTTRPSEQVIERAVRRWVSSSYEGDIHIVGELAKIDVGADGSNGVDAFILVDGIEVYAGFVEADDAAGLSYEADGKVKVGSKVDFVLDAHEGNDHHDLTRFTAVIERVIRQSD
jgi:hypothetical protein